MKTMTEFIILHEDGPMPNEETFCPSMWKNENSDIEGDYYYDNINERWTTLNIKREIQEDKITALNINVYREKNRNYEPSLCEADDLKRYIEYRNQGRYVDNEEVMRISNLCVTSLKFETYDNDSYFEFLQTTYNFLKYSKGIIANHNEIDENSFKKEFL